MQRILRMVLVGSLVAAVLVLVPAPQVVWASELETITTEPPAEIIALADSAIGQRVVAPPAAEVADDHDHDNDHDGDQEDHGDPVAVRSATESGLAVFTAIGVTTERAPSAPVVVRVALEGAWGPWRELSSDEDHRPDGDELEGAPAGTTTEPLFVERADAYEVQVPVDAGEFEVHLVTEVRRRLRVVDDTADAGASPTIRPRSDWGARAPGEAPADAGELKFAVVHHSVNSNDYSQASVPAMLRSIQAYHMDANGWDDIAYNFAVDRFGTIWEARAGGVDRAIIGGHAFGFNTASTGVVVLGDYGSAAPTSASVQAVEELLAWKLALHHTPTTGTVTYRSLANTHFGPAGTPVEVQRISGHRDVRQTGCPGTSLYSRLGSIRSNVEAITPSAQSQVPASMIPGDRNGDGAEDLLLYRPGSAGDRSLTGAAGPDLDSGPTRVTGRYQTLSGDFDGDGKSDVFWYAPGSAADYVWYGRAQGHRSQQVRVNGSYRPLVGDFDGDGRSDIFWYGEWGVLDSVWYGTPNGFDSRRASVGNWYEPHLGDFDGDGRTDVFWYRPGSDPDYVWFGTAGRGFVSTSQRVSGYYRPILGDFSGDGRTDILWYDPGPSPDYRWTATAGRGFTSTSQPVSGTYDTVVGDFDGNGYDDIFWNAADGASDHHWLHRAGGHLDGGFRIDGGHRMVALDADGNGDDELFTLEGLLSGRLWNLRSNGTFSAVAVP